MCASTPFPSHEQIPKAKHIKGINYITSFPGDTRMIDTNCAKQVIPKKWDGLTSSQLMDSHNFNLSYYELCGTQDEKS